MKKIALLLSALTVGLAVQAQTPISVTGTTLTYTQDFNNLDTTSAGSAVLPAGWAIYEFGTSATTVNQQYKGSNGSSNTGDTYSFGTSGVAERALGSIASGSITSHYGAKFTNNTGVPINGFTITYKGEQWRFGGPTAPATSRTNADSLRFLYSITASGVSDTVSANYTESTALMFNSPNFSGAAPLALDGNASGNFTNKTGTVSVTIPAGSSIVIKWIDKNVQGNDDGLAVDDVNIVFTTTGTPTQSNAPTVTALSPVNGATNVATNSNLSITFDRAVTTGTGSIRVTNQTDHTAAQVIAASTATVSGRTVTIPGLILLNSKTYYVMFDSTAFDSAGYKTAGIYDSTSWKFTTIAASVGTVTSLGESFNSSCATGLPAGWQQISLAGAATWRCSTTAPNYYVSINGGGASSSDSNQDWLITPQLAATANMKLSFSTRYNFGGRNMEVLYSTNYSGTGDPTLATWNTLVNPYSATDSNRWYNKSAQLTAGNMYIAFKYISQQSATSGNAKRWDVDSVYTSLGTQGAINNVSRNNTLGVQVLGVASNSNVMIGFDLESAASVKAIIYDMAGREVFNSTYAATKGNNKLKLEPNLQSGMYIIRISNGKDQGIARTFVQ